MEELITCPKYQFIQKIQEISIKEMQELLWKLEERYQEMQNDSKESQKVSLLDRVGNPMPTVEMTGRLELKQKIHICREELLKAKYRAASERTQGLETFDRESFSWGIKEASEPEVILEANTGMNYWEKIGGNAPESRNETIKVINCGEFRWSDKLALSVDEMPNQAQGAYFTVQAEEGENGEKIIQAADLLEKLQTIDAQSGKLKLLRVTIQGEQKLEYFMLVAIEQLQNMDRKALQEYFTTTYLSRAHQDMVMSSLENDNCLYGGTIIQNENGKFETRFYDLLSQAVAKANMSAGTCMTAEGKNKFGTIQDIIDGISGRLARKESLGGLKKALVQGVQQKQEETNETH